MSLALLHDRPMGSATDMVAIGARLRALRLALSPELGFGQQSDFARWLGLTPQSWNNIERGFARPSIDIARKIRAKTGVSHDWIFEGDDRFLPHHLAVLLDQVGREARSA